MAAMDECRGNQTKVAERLGINRATLRTKLKRHGINRWDRYDRLAAKARDFLTDNPAFGIKNAAGD